MRQEVKSIASEKKEMLEVWVVPQATLQLESNLNEFERLKNLEVRAGQGLDLQGSVQAVLALFPRTVCCFCFSNPKAIYMLMF